MRAIAAAPTRHGSGKSGALGSERRLQGRPAGRAVVLSRSRMTTPSCVSSDQSVSHSAWRADAAIIASQIENPAVGAAARTWPTRYPSGSLPKYGNVGL